MLQDLVPLSRASVLVDFYSALFGIVADVDRVHLVVPHVLESFRLA